MITFDRLNLRCILICIVFYKIILRCLVKVRLIIFKWLNHWIIDRDRLISAWFSLRKHSIVAFNWLNLRFIHLTRGLTLASCLAKERSIFFSWLNHWILSFFCSFSWSNGPVNSLIFFTRLQLTNSFRLLSCSHPTDVIRILLVERLILVTNRVQCKWINSLIFSRHIQCAVSKFLRYLGSWGLIIGYGSSNYRGCRGSLLNGWSWRLNRRRCGRWLWLSILGIISLNRLSHLSIVWLVVFYLRFYFYLFIYFWSSLDWSIYWDRLWRLFLRQILLRLKWIWNLNGSVISLNFSCIIMLIRVFKFWWYFCDWRSLGLLWSGIGLHGKAFLWIFSWFYSYLHIHISDLWFS